MTLNPEGLKESLAKLKISQGALARHLGVRPETVNRWIKGKHPIPGPVVRAIQDLLEKEERGGKE